MKNKPNFVEIAKEDKMSSKQILSFKGGSQTVVLPINSVLWRFVSKQNDKKFGAYWLDTMTMQSIMRTLQANHDYSESFKKDNIRNSLALLVDWSELNWRIKITLRKEVIAYVGNTELQKQFKVVPNAFPFGGDDKIEKVTETRLGGHVQYVVPRFEGLPDSNECANVELMVHV